jgi:wyosine [tRNA(Phe)-imidazoG37] synthetase (radical SAM superfamily)
MAQVYGPVPSRRLGFSLGVDIAPFKTCSLDCVYCQLGRTTNKTIERREYIGVDQILRELEKVLKEEGEIDYITFSGSGEPTLNSNIGKMISRVKKMMTSIPIAVLTNGTLLYQPQVREDLLEADLVIPSLDAASQNVFERVNRPHPLLKINEIISGISAFSREFRGKIWLEIMLVKGINDSLEEVKKMAQVVEEIGPDKTQLNTVIRPPAEKFAQALDIEDLKRIRKILGEERCEVIAEFKGIRQKAYKKDIEGKILRTLQRRPLTISDISYFLGLHRNEVIKYIGALEEQGKIGSVLKSSRRYYEIIVQE